MLRRVPCLFATNIPRNVWDPAHFNTNWSDSYGNDIAARRHWPAKKWSVGLEPRTPRDWLQFSYRNLAYAYNGALRACQSFPEMLVYYKEMKQRGVKVDVDTMNILLTRAARYEQIQMDDVFLLFDELMTLGARPDIAAVETLHTVLDHSVMMPYEWREARRRQLIELYNYLAMEEIERLASYHVDLLLKKQIQRYRDNLRLLHASLSPSVYCRYLHTIYSASLLLEEVHNFLWELVENDHPAMDIPALQLRVPFVASVMKRPAVDINETTVKYTDFEDTDICSVFLAAAERAVDVDFHDHRPVSERRIFLSLLTMISYSGVLYTSDLMAHLMEMVKYSTSESRDSDAQRLLRYAIRGSSAAHDGLYRSLWHKVELVTDSRVVGRYISARDPWSPTRMCFDEKGLFKPYPILMNSGGRKLPSDEDGKMSGMKEKEDGKKKNDDDDDDMVEGVRGSVMTSGEMKTTASDNTNKTLQQSSSSEECTVEALNLRWNDLHRLIERTYALTSPPSERHPQQEKMEVFTGIAVYLRTIATGRRYKSDDNDNSNNNNEEKEKEGNMNILTKTQQQQQTLFALGYGLDIWERLFSLVQEVRHDMEKFITENIKYNVEPEFECWEALLITLRCILDFCVVQKQELTKGNEREGIEKLFQKTMELRNELVEESRTRFGGRMRILWLQES